MLIFSSILFVILLWTILDMKGVLVSLPQLCIEPSGSVV